MGELLLQYADGKTVRVSCDRVIGNGSRFIKLLDDGVYLRSVPTQLVNSKAGHNGNGRAEDNDSKGKREEKPPTD